MELKGELPEKNEEKSLNKIIELSSIGAENMIDEMMIFVRGLCDTATVGLAIMLRKELRIIGCIGASNQ